MNFSKTALAALVLASGMALSPLGAVDAKAAFCSDSSARFGEWKAAIKAEYKGQFKASTLNKLDGVNYSNTVIKSDRNQKSFKLSFAEFYKRRAGGVASGARKKIKQYQKYFDKAEAQYGVQPAIIAAIWGLESGFGNYKGQQLPILESVATLAYDCRRTELFNRELKAAFTVIERGVYDLSKARGAWAGEIGQTQFLPSSFLVGAADFDGGGVDVFNSAPDVIGSTAKWFKANGWQAGADFHEGTANYNVIKKWNKATVYQQTIAKLADEIN